MHKKMRVVAVAPGMCAQTKLLFQLKVERELEEAVETVGEYCALTDCSQLFVAR